MPVLSISTLSKRYGYIQALKELTLDVYEGQVLGLLGPNGSGKTTTLGIILGIIKADGGNFTWFDGLHNQDHRLKIGAILETPNFYPYMTASQNLDVIRQIKKAEYSDFEELLRMVNLWDRRDSKFSTYSLGMKQRLAIAATLIGNPEVLIFDEPTNGLDPKGIAEVRDILQKLAKSGKTIIMASHILDEVEKVCSHVAILKSGTLLAHGKVGSILTNDITVEVACSDMQALHDFIKTLPFVKDFEGHDSHFDIQIDASLQPEEINKLAYEAGLYLTHFVFRKRKLEEEFLTITERA
ncbi:MAG: ATP-binding cassette domain-containing protein [Saprospiraceae bacterium]